MRRQYRATGFLALLLAGLACGPEHDDTAGIAFAEPEALLGTLVQGPDREISFDFEVSGEPVRIESFEVSCGCIEPRLLAEGRPVPLGSLLPPGQRGQVEVKFRTRGFEGPKEATLAVIGEGPGLPATLSLRAMIEPYFRAEPPRLELGVLSGSEEQTLSVGVSGPEPFLLERVDPAAEMPGHPFRLEGIPSAAPAREQEFRVVLAPEEGEEGVQKVPLSIHASGGHELVYWVTYEMARTLWVKPSRFVLLGAIPQGVQPLAYVDVGAREGVLELPRARIEGLPGAEVHCVPFGEAPNQYRVRISLPADLPPGPVSGRLVLDLLHNLNGSENRMERVLTLAGVVQKKPEPSQS